MFVKFQNRIKYYYLKFIWSTQNKNNHTYPESYFPIEKVNVGNHTYGPINILHYHAENAKLLIGNYVSIAEGVKFILGGNHPQHLFSSFPFKKKVLMQKIVEEVSKGPIVIKDDVWIGHGAIILSGVTVNQGAIIAAGSVVVKDVPPYAKVGGNPARLIGHRYDLPLIKKIEHIDLSKIDRDFINANVELLYSPLTVEILDQLKKQLHQY